MMAKNPDDRFRTPAAVALALLPFTHANSILLAAPPLAVPKPPAAGKDDTPLPPALAGQPDRAARRLPRLAAKADDTGHP
jgi:hypothetical protein